MEESTKADQERIQEDILQLQKLDENPGPNTPRTQFTRHDSNREAIDFAQQALDKAKEKQTSFLFAMFTHDPGADRVHMSRTTWDFPDNHLKTVVQMLRNDMRQELAAGLGELSNEPLKEAEL